MAQATCRQVPTPVESGAKQAALWVAVLCRITLSALTSGIEGQYTLWRALFSLLKCSVCTRRHTVDSLGAVTGFTVPLQHPHFCCSKATERSDRRGLDPAAEGADGQLRGEVHGRRPGPASRQAALLRLPDASAQPRFSGALPRQPAPLAHCGREGPARSRTACQPCRLLPRRGGTGRGYEGAAARAVWLTTAGQSAPQQPRAAAALPASNLQ